MRPYSAPSFTCSWVVRMKYVRVDLGPPGRRASDRPMENSSLVDATLSFSTRRALALLEEARAILLAPLGPRSLSERRADLGRGRTLALRAKEMLARELGCGPSDVPWTLPDLPPSCWPSAVAEETADGSLSTSALRASLGREVALSRDAKG